MADLPLPEQGDIWLNKNSLALKYNLENKNRTLIPQDWYISGETISRGNIVSIADSDWKPGNSGKIYKTDSGNVDKTIGIALNNALSGEPIEIQRSGIFTFDSNIFIPSDIGKIAYVKIDPDGEMTTDKNSAILGGNALIEVGQVVALNQLLIAVEGDNAITDFVEYLSGEAIDTSGTPKLVHIGTDGKAYLSSKQRSVGKNNIAGFIVDTEIGLTTIPINTKVLVKRNGVIEGFTGLQAGQPVYASGTDINFGTVTQNKASISPYYDSFIYLGLAKSSNELILQVQPAYDNLDTSPIGTITLTKNGTPDSGNLLMNGQILNAVTNPEYQALYGVVGNSWGGTDNTNFILGNLNGGILKYQIKFDYFYQFQPVYTPIYQIEYPTSTTWQPYSNPLSLNIDISSFNLLSLDDVKDLQIKVYAKKNAKQVFIPDYFVQNPGTGNRNYGYSFELLSPSSLTINFATNGFAYVDTNGNLIALDGTWFYKIIVQKNERLNRYRDSDSDLKLNRSYLKIEPYFDEVGRTENLHLYSNFNSMTLITDPIMDNSGNNRNGTNFSCSIVINNEVKYLSGNGSSQYFSYGDQGKITGALSVSCRVKLNANATTNRNLIGKWGSSGGFRQYSLGYSALGIPRLLLSSDGSTSIIDTTFSYALSTTDYEHIGFVYIPSTAIYLYRNGVLVNSITSGIPSSLFNSSQSLECLRGLTSSDYANAQISCVRIFNAAISHEDMYKISEIY